MTSVLHLVRRFFEVVRAEPLSEEEMAEVDAWLTPDLQSLFRSQHVADQRHGYSCARRVLRKAPARGDLAPAALLHDVGKRHAGLGAVGRSLATVAGSLGLPKTAAWATYLDHPALGGIELSRLGADPITIAFAFHQEHERPEAIDPESWRLLRLADHGAEG